MIFKSYKFRLYPDSEHKSTCAKNFGAKRWINNHYLAENQERFKNKEPHMNCFAINLDITQLKKNPETEWLREIDDWVLKSASEDLHVAYSNFFNSIKGKRKGQAVKAPKFKNKHSRQSFRTRGVKVDFENGFVKLPKMKKMKCVFDREFDGKIKSATVSKTPSGKYFISILVEEEEQLKPQTGNEVGIDLGLKDLCILSNGVKFLHPEAMLAKAKSALKKQQKILSRKTKGSSNYEKQRIKVAKCYETVTNIRNWYYHNVSSYLVENFDAIYMEDLNVSGMLKNRKLSRKIHETAWATLVGMISYKCSWYGKTFYQIGRFAPSSKTCSCCGYKNKELKLSMREWECPDCNSLHDRDLNAAINIKNFGQADCYGQLLTSVETPEAEEIPISLQKHSNKIERSPDESGVRMGSKKTQRSLVVG